MNGPWPHSKFCATFIAKVAEWFTGESDDTESDKTASDAEDNEAVERKNETDDGHKDKSHFDRDCARIENGNVSSPPLVSTETDGLSDLPPYLPAIQGCRSIKEYDYLNRQVYQIKITINLCFWNVYISYVLCYLHSFQYD